MTNYKSSFLIFVLPFIVCPFLYTSHVSADTDNNVTKIMDKIENTMNNVKTYKQFIKTYEYGKFASESTRYYEVPNKFSETTKIYANDGNVIMSKTINDGTNIWTYAPFEKLITKKNAKLNPPVNEMSFMPNIDSSSQVNFIGEDKKFYIIEIIKRNDKLKGTPLEKMKCYYRKDIGYPGRVIFYDPEGKESTDMALSYSMINKPFDDHVFKFTVPKSIPVIDLENQKGHATRIGVGVEGTKITPIKILNKSEIVMQTDKFAKDLGFDINKCQKNIKKENRQWTVEYFNKSGNVSYKKITFLLNEQGQYLGVLRSPD